jgi:hypothetical protein
MNAVAATWRGHSATPAKNRPFNCHENDQCLSSAGMLDLKR